MERPDLDAIEQVRVPDAEHVDILIAYARHLEEVVKQRDESMTDRLTVLQNKRKRLKEFETALEPLGALMKRPGMYLGPEHSFNESLKNLEAVYRNRPLDDPYKHPHT